MNKQTALDEKPEYIYNNNLISFSVSSGICSRIRTITLSLHSLTILSNSISVSFSSKADIIEIENITEDGELTDDAESKINVSKISDSVTKGIKNVGAGITNLFSKQEAKKEKDDNLEQIKKLKELLDLGAITQEEFDAKKKELLGL